MAIHHIGNYVIATLVTRILHLPRGKIGKRENTPSHIIEDCHIFLHKDQDASICTISHNHFVFWIIATKIY